MRLVDHAQGSDAWLEWRVGKATASVADVVMGCAPSWKKTSVADLKLQIAGLETRTLNAFARRAIAHGHREEPKARAFLASTMEPACLESTDDPRFTASLDGWIDSLVPWWCEIKSPFTGTRSSLYRALEDDDAPIPRHLWWQLVHQAGVIGRPDARCKLIVWARGGPNPRFRLREIAAEDLLADWPALKRRWLEVLDGDGGNRAKLSRAWLHAKARLDEAKADLDAARDALIELGPGEDAGVRVTTSTRAGRLDLKRLQNALDIPDDVIADFRKPSTEFTIVRKVRS